MAVRCGVGYDIHRFGEGSGVILGGVEIEFGRALEAHSDGDVVLHAIADALLGAAALGDIGVLFPPDDEAFRDADSSTLLREVERRVRDAGFSVVNIDVTVLAEAPRIAPHALAMRERIADVLGLGASAVSVKGTTLETLGALGRGEGIACLAICALETES